jgi:hypothetical protein
MEGLGRISARNVKPDAKVSAVMRAPVPAASDYRVADTNNSRTPQFANAQSIDTRDKSRKVAHCHIADVNPYSLIVMLIFIFEHKTCLDKLLGAIPRSSSADALKGGLVVRFTNYFQPVFTGSQKVVDRFGVRRLRSATRYSAAEEVPKYRETDENK